MQGRLIVTLAVEIEMKSNDIADFDADYFAQQVASSVPWGPGGLGSDACVESVEVVTPSPEWKRSER